MSATAVGGAKQNPAPMNPPPQLLIPGPWTVHRLEGGGGLCAVAHGAWRLGAVTPGRQYRSATWRQGSIGLGQC